MPQSIAIIIANGGRYQTEDIKILDKTFYRMDMRVHTLIDKPSMVIRKAINSIIEVDPSTISDVICVVRTFETTDGHLDLYDDVITPLLEANVLQEKTKLIITSAAVSLINSATQDNTNKLYKNAKKLTIIGSTQSAFIPKFIPLLTNGKVNDAVDKCSELIAFTHRTEAKIELSIPSSGLTWPSHEFV